MNCNKVNRLRKVLQIVLAVLLLACACLLISACKHEHNYQSQVTVQPTCTEVGEITYTCAECGKSYTEEAPVISHDLSYVCLGSEHWQSCKNCAYATSKTTHSYDKVLSTAPATCYSTGIEIKACVCGDTTNVTLPMIEHSFTVAQNDTANHWLKCADCSQTSNVEPHKFTTTVSSTNSTCQINGSVVTKCDCGATHTDTLPLLEHSYTVTAFDDESHWSACSMCNQVEPINGKTLHNTSVVATDPDCEKAGKIVTTCSGCEYAKTVAIPALGHQFDKTVFSKSSTGSGHYYKCTVCKNDIAEPHTLEDCDCPDGDNRAATCYKAGHQDQICSVCEWRNHFTTPMTDDHNWSSEWTSSGTFHWHVCLNGDGACTAKGDETQHTWEAKTVAATCVDNGREWRECSVCAHEQSGSNKILKATGHDYEDVRVITPAECEKAGEVEQRCKTCGNETVAAIKATGHDMSSYNMELTDVNGHYRMCSVCGFTNSTVRNHTWDELILSAPTCNEHGETDRTCQYCKYHYVLETTRNHDYHIVEDSYVEATCKDDGHHDERCSLCGNVNQVIDPKLTTHPQDKLKEFPAKEMTETEPGNRHYWQCQVCGRYFSGHGCDYELFEEDIFTYPPKGNVVDSIAKLIEIASSLANGVLSNDYYQITATVDGYDAESNVFLISDDTEAIYVTLNERENANTIEEKDIITLKGKLFRLNEDVTLLECKVVSIQCDDDEIHSLFINVINDSRNQSLYLENLMAHVEEFDDEWYYGNSNNYNCLMTGCTLVFNNYIYGVVLQKVVINGNSYNMQDRELKITIGNEDIYAEFVFDDDNYCSVTLRELNTSNNQGNSIVADEYISYTYTNGGYNEYGRLYKDSHLTFTAENAHITGINITYDVDWLDKENNIKALENAVNVIKNGVKFEYEQGDLSNRGQVKITIPVTELCTVLEYFANVGQARVTEIIILYQTYNS